MTITTVRSMVRCTRCRCSDEMHFEDGCHTAVGFICNCKLTQDEVLGITMDFTTWPTVAEVREMLIPEVEVLPTIEDEALVAEFLPLGPAKATATAQDMEFVHAGERF